MKIRYLLEAVRKVCLCMRWWKVDGEGEGGEYWMDGELFWSDMVVGWGYH